MRQKAALMCAIVLAGFAFGCVERQMMLDTEPQGAKVYYNDAYVGQTPVTFHFTYYQAPRLRIEKDGYDTLSVSPKVKAPAYEHFPIDFFAESLVPWTIHDRHRLNYTLKETAPADVNELINRSQELGKETMQAK